MSLPLSGTPNSLSKNSLSKNSLYGQDKRETLLWGKELLALVGAVCMVWMWIAFKGLQALHFIAYFLYSKCLGVASLTFIGVRYNEP